MYDPERRELLEILHNLVNPEDEVSDILVARIVQTPLEVSLLALKRLLQEEIINKTFHD